MLVNYLQMALYIAEDNRQNYEETRYSGLGYISGLLLNVVYTERYHNIIRIISFRKANNREKNRFEQGIENQLD